MAGFEYGKPETEAVAVVVWEAIWGDGSTPTTPLSKSLAADRAARALMDSGYLLSVHALRAEIAETQRSVARERVPSARR